MIPVFDLTVDEAVSELEQVCDQLMDAPDPKPKNLTTRKTELQAWILMHQGRPKAADPVPTDPAPPEQDEPMPRPRLSPEEKHAKKLEYQRLHRAKVKAAAGDVSKKPRKVRTSAGRVEETPESVQMPASRLEHPYEAAIELGKAIERHVSKPAPTDALLARLAYLQGQVLGITSEAVVLPAADRSRVLEAAANLDALAHQLAQFLATGRIEVAA